jgi:DNA mismatch repair protein MutS
MDKLLIIDEQTINDLSIFGRSGKPSIYDLYNGTTTQGGAAILEGLFRHPLADERLINARSAVYQFFSSTDYSFPVDAPTIGTLAYYLENTDVRSQLQTGGQSLGQRLKDMVAADSDTVFVHDGVQACLRLCYQLSRFIHQLRSGVGGTAYETSFNRLVEVFGGQPFKEMRELASAKFEVRLNQVVLAGLDKSIRFDHREKVLQLLEMLYELDVCIAVGQVARKRNFHFSRALPKESEALHYKKVYHPRVDGAIANDLYLDNSHNVLFLTGANMAGKSTLMKSVGIALYLGHIGLPVAAEELTFAVRDGIYTSINLADNLNAGASHYYAEVLRVKEVARELSEGKKLFVIFDELFRGTNVKDAYDATIALTRAFCSQRGSQFIISTHIMETGEFLEKELLPIKYRFLPTQMVGHTPVYTRVLKEGITADRQGMLIIENEGILEMLDAGIKEKEERICHS